MKKFRRLTALLLCALVLGTSCTKDGGDNTKNGETAGEIAKTEILTNVFRGTGIALPEDYSIVTGVKPYYNAETGEMRLLCSHGYESDVVNEYGYNEYIRETVLLTVDSGNTVVNEQKLELGDNVYVNSGVLTADRLYYIHNRYDEASMTDSFHAAVCDLADGTVTMSDDVKVLFSQTDNEWFYLQYLAVDGDGFLYLAADQEIVVLNDAFVKQFSVTSQNWINEMTTSADGTVWAAGYFDSGYGFVPIYKTAKAFGKTVELPANMNANQYLFADGYDVYLSTDDGLYGYNFASAEAAEPELVFSYANSDLHGNGVEVARVVGPDCVILYEQDPETYAQYPAVYNRSADIDLSQVKVLEIAFTNSEWNLSSSIVKFNKANDGVRIIARDYSQYNTDEDYQAGAKKLVNDILLGIYKPDMVTGYSASEDVVSQIYANGLYTDLYPLMEADGTIAKDDLLGCVTRTFEADDGKLWALGSAVTVQTLMGTKEMLGDRTDMEHVGWTLSEMIDFAESLPEGAQLMLGMSQQSAIYNLLGYNGYSMFVDMQTNTCNFEGEDFIRYLEFLNGLPATYDEAMTAVPGSDDYQTQYLLYHNGQVVLKPQYYYGVNDWVGRDAEFNTPEVVDIGYPTADGTNGSQVDMTPYVITSFCEYPDAAWDFIESMVKPERTERYYSHNGLPVLKDEFLKACEEEYDSLFEIYFDGGMSWGPYNPEYDDLEAEMREPGIRKFFTEEDAQAMLKWFDEDIGAPAVSAVDPEITEIVNEEVTSYLGGAKSAADCARVIQSRVSIWLAEHE